MKYPALGLLFAFTFLLLLPASASPLDDKLTALKSAVKDEALSKAKAAQPNGIPPVYNPPNSLNAIDQFISQLDNSNTSNNGEMQIKMQINLLLSAFSSDTVQKAAQAVINEIDQERRDRVDAANAKVQALLKRTSDAVTQAQKASDLDDVLVELQKYQATRSGLYDQSNQALYQQVSNAFEFTKLWQNYLFHLSSGQTQLAQNDLQSLSQNNYGIGIIPRSEILDRLNNLTSGATGKQTTPSSTADTILQGIKTLDDMEPALRQLEKLRGTDVQAQMAYGNLSNLVQVYAMAKAGLPTALNLNLNAVNGPTVSPYIQSQLILFVLQSYFDSYKGTPPASEEKPDAFIKRVLADAVDRNDWPLLQKAFSAQAYFERTSPIGQNYAFPNGIDFLLAGLNQDAACQYTLAVISYQNALKCANPSLPAKVIGDKLASIQKDHPKEYAEGMQLILNAPSSVSYPYRSGYPGYPVRQMAPPSEDSLDTDSPPPSRLKKSSDSSTNQSPVKPVPPAPSALHPAK